jgi:hypothetical protein
MTDTERKTPSDGAMTLEAHIKDVARMHLDNRAAHALDSDQRLALAHMIASQAAKDWPPVSSSDGAVTARLLTDERLSLIRKAFETRSIWTANEGDQRAIADLLSHITALTAERDRLAEENETLKASQALAASQYQRTVKIMAGMDEKRSAAEAKAARVEEALKEIAAFNVPSPRHAVNVVADMQTIANAALTLPEPSHEP